MNHNPPTIDHNPHQRRLGNVIWWVAWAVVATLWIGQWYFDTFDRGQIALGFVTGSVLATWTIEITGNKVPDSWRRQRRG